MDDPWDVKSVRQAGDYISCLKLHGEPLLPPVLSKECRDEMRYYKILAQEVEKRISLIQPCLSDSEVEEMQRAASPELCDFDHGEQTSPNGEQSSTNGEQSSTNVNATINVQFNHSNNLELKKYSHNNHDHNSEHTKHNSEHTKEIHISSPSPDGRDSQRSTLVMDISLHIKKNTHESCSSGKGSPELYLPIEDVPERDYEWKKKELLSDVDSYSSKTRESLYSPVKESPQKLSGMFTGSLNDLYCKNVQNSSTLMRQRSYTLIEPGPMLLAHLAVESLNTGVDMNCISMSESLSNVSFSPTRKRRSWDLESAKVKWSSMALELKQNIIPKPQAEVSKPQVEVSKPQVEVPKPQGLSKPLKRPRAQSVIDKRPIVLNKVTKPSPVSEPITRTSKPNSTIKRISPERTLTNRTLTKANPIQSPKKMLKAPEDPVSPNLESEDPATRVRQLYDKIQQQQMSQMSSLIEKQKQEKILLKQIFEEQNNMLFKQLKSICPESPIEVKRAWGKTEHGPVKLSQLIGEPQAPISPPPVKNTPNSKSVPKRPLSQRNKTTAFSQRHGNVTPGSARSGRSEQCDGSITRTHSPASGAARQLSYDSEAPLTDHTGDTLQDLNVTFPTDSENSTRRGPRASPRSSSRDTHAAIRYMEQSIHNSINGVKEQNTQKERDAATRIVACARGWLVRRLMRTERVRATVQTIRDALLCALQLHTDARGIRGADVDLHRRLIQQITAACYSLHETFISSTPAERCAIIAADRGRRRSLAAKISPKVKQRDIMSQSHSGAFPARPKRAAPSLMTQSSYEVYPNDNCHRTRYMPSPRRRPWR